jgi:hypothetical protein
MTPININELTILKDYVLEKIMAGATTPIEI